MNGLQYANSILANHSDSQTNLSTEINKSCCPSLPPLPAARPSHSLGSCRGIGMFQMNCDQLSHEGEEK